MNPFPSPFDRPPAPKTLTELIAAHPMLQNVAIGVHVEDGWVPLLHALCSRIEHRCKYHPDVPMPVVAQVKEKFGTLRFYVDGVEAYTYFYGLIDMAEGMSAIICERCGNSGKLRTARAWLRTLCDECDKRP